MTVWMQELVVLLEAEFHARKTLATLATVDLKGRPRARTIFVRQIDQREDSLVFTTDARSEKMAHLTASRVAELVFWAPHERQQFRLLGDVEIVREGQQRSEQWQQMSEPSRAMFYWPAPGEPRGPAEAFPATAPAGAPPESFVLLVMYPTEVESLELNYQPHRRRRWRRAENWQTELINP